ncbi:MAG: hypothetical protein P8L68_11300, partial [Paracoccaceae bacterium]|nr:hypothetical protein [Paracoccaceae bacterium]MDG2259068.1 hypothetical protein [Paracoccaceae bacterium]
LWLPKMKANGPERSLPTAVPCCIAARECGHSLRARNQMMGELTQCGRCCRSQFVVEWPDMALRGS